MSGWAEDFPEVHRALAPEYRSLPEEHVESIVQDMFGPSVGLAEAEGFFDDIGRGLTRLGRAAAPIAGRALAGATSGAALGPYGALGGAVLSGLGPATGAAQPTRSPGRPATPPPAAWPPAPAAGLPAPTASPTSTPPVPPSIGGEIPAAVPPGVAGEVPVAAPGSAIPQLLTALSSPTVQGALAALLMGPAGAPSVPGAGEEMVQTPAILNMLGMLTGRAAAEAENWGWDGERIALPEGLDEADPEVRGDWVFGRLAPPPDPVELGPADGGGNDEGALDEMYDELEAEFYAEALAVEVALTEDDLGG